MEFLDFRTNGSNPTQDFLNPTTTQNKIKTGRLIMAEATKGSMVYVYDKEGNAYICDIDDLRDASQVSDEEKAGCTDLDRGGFSRNE
jgi:hypothetical protein